MKLLIFTACLLCFAGCQNNDVPNSILNKDSMGKILWDIIRADQFSLQYLTKDSARVNVKAETMKLYEEVFRIHRVSRDEFQKSFQYYLAHPDITKIMFDSLSAQANRQRAEVFKTPSRTNPK